MVETICDNCGKKIERNKYEIETCERHFCNRKCYGKWRSQNRICANHPNWIDVPKNEIIDLYKSGCTITKISKMHHISQGTIYSRFKKWDILLINKNAEIKCDNCGEKTKRRNCLIKAWKHHFCNKKCYDEWRMYPIKLEPTYSLGYLIGVIFGDGHINLSQNRIIITTADIDWIGTLITIINEICPQISTVGIQSYEYWGKAVQVGIYSKKLCKVLKPFKLEPHRYNIPPFLNTPESLAGLVAGLIDTDGCIQIHRQNINIELTSKYVENLIPIEKILKNIFEINSKIYSPPSRESSVLRIAGYANLFRFEQKIGLIMTRRQNLLQQAITEAEKKYKRREYSKQRIEEMVHLYKNKNLSLRQIANKLDVSKDYVCIVARRNNLSRRTIHTPEQYNDVINLRKMGHTIEEISFLTSISIHAIREWIYRNRKPLSVHMLEAENG